VHVAGFDSDRAASHALVDEGIATAPSLDALASVLPTPRVVWLMVPADDTTRLALMSRFASQGGGDYANRMLATMRKAFGGHPVARQTP
jgi:6-phosphogluconate dehydrogenase